MISRFSSTELASDRRRARPAPPRLPKTARMRSLDKFALRDAALAWTGALALATLIFSAVTR